jgi:hypothetical protein
MPKLGLVYVTHRHEMSVEGDFCDIFSTTQSITYLVQGVIGKHAPAPSISNEDFDLICISSGVICFVCFAFLTAAFALICDLQQYKVLGGYLAGQIWPNLHILGDFMQIRPRLNPKISKVVRDNPLAHLLLNPQAYPHHIDPQAHNKPFVSPFPLGVLGE